MEKNKYSIGVHFTDKNYASEPYEAYISVILCNKSKFEFEIKEFRVIHSSSENNHYANTANLLHDLSKEFNCKVNVSRDALAFIHCCVENNLADMLSSQNDVLPFKVDKLSNSKGLLMNHNLREHLTRLIPDDFKSFSERFRENRVESLLYALAGC